MRLLALAPLFALASAKLSLDLDLDSFTSKILCPSGASTSTLWLADDNAFACAPLPSLGEGSYASLGKICITAPTAELRGEKDTCEGAADCGGGVCVEAGGDMRRVCWTVSSGGECGRFSKLK